MLPALVLIVMFSFYPIVASWFYSLLDWSGIGGDRTFIGLDNYREIVGDPFFWDAFRRSFYFMFATVPFEVGFSLIVAVILNDRALRFGAVFRTFFFVPVVTTTAITSIVMSFVFGAFNGPVNGALIRLNILDTPIDWLGDPDTALWTMALIGIWKWFGQPMIYWLAALQTIPQDLYEAARVDGAGSVHIFRTITIPLLISFGVVELARIWVLRTLGPRWTTRIIIVPGEQLVARGPYRFISHPNYAVVVAEIALLPMVFGLWQIAIIFSLLNLVILSIRIRAENDALESVRT